MSEAAASARVTVRGKLAFVFVFLDLHGSGHDASRSETPRIQHKLFAMSLPMVCQSAAQRFANWNSRRDQLDTEPGQGSSCPWRNWSCPPFHSQTATQADSRPSSPTMTNAENNLSLHGLGTAFTLNPFHRANACRRSFLAPNSQSTIPVRRYVRGAPTRCDYCIPE